MDQTDSPRGYIVHTRLRPKRAIAAVACCPVDHRAGMAERGVDPLRRHGPSVETGNVMSNSHNRGIYKNRTDHIPRCAPTLTPAPPRHPARHGCQPSTVGQEGRTVNSISEICRWEKINRPGFLGGSTP